MAITFDDVLNVAVKEDKKLETLTQQQRDFCLTFASKIVHVEQYGDLTDEAQTYLAGHYAMKMVTRSAGEGSISSESLGEISRTVTMEVNNPTAKEGLLTTIYGRQFYEIRDTMQIFNMG